LLFFCDSVSADTTPTPEEQQTILHTIVLITASLGVLGALFIILSFIFIKELQNFIGIVVFNISIADFLNTFALLFDANNTSVSVCNFQAFMGQFASLAGIIWVACLCVTIYVLLVKLDRNPKYLLKYFIAIGWGFPLLTAIYMLATDGYGNAGPWCWMLSTRVVERFLLYYNFVFLDFIITIAVLAIAWYKVRMTAIEAGRSNSTVKNLTIIFAKRAVKYIFVFLICYTASIVNRIENAINPNTSVFWLTCLQATLFPLHGLLNGIVFGNNNYNKMHTVILNKLKNRNEKVKTEEEEEDEET